MKERVYNEYSRREPNGEMRVRCPVSMRKELLDKVDELGKMLNTTRPDVIEIMVAFYFCYVEQRTMKERSVQ